MAHWLLMLRPARPERLTEGPSETETRGLVIFQAEDESAATALMEGDPAVRQGVMTVTLQPYAIALAGRIPPTP